MKKLTRKWTQKPFATSTLKTNAAWLHFPDKKHLAFRNLFQVPKVWSVFIRASFVVHVPQGRPFLLVKLHLDKPCRLPQMHLSFSLSFATLDSYHIVIRSSNVNISD